MPMMGPPPIGRRGSREAAATAFLLSVALSIVLVGSTAPPGFVRPTAPREFGPPAAGDSPLASAAAPGPAGTADSAVEDFLAASDASLSGVRLRTVRRIPTASGVTHLFQEQVGPGGIPVVPGYVKTALGAHGGILRAVLDLAPPDAVAAAGDAAAVATAGAGDAASAGSAEAAALAHLGYSKDGISWYKPIKVEPVLIRHGEGGASVTPGHRVRTWTAKGNMLHDTYVSADGQVAWSACHTRNDSYRVYTRSPLTGPQVMVAGPRPGPDAPSPHGWLAGNGVRQRTQQIKGNNAEAYLDLRDRNEPGGKGGSKVTDGVFDSVADLSSGNPNSTRNRNAAVQNLFYLVNRAHDDLWRAGFTESAGNFQARNWNRGGTGGDALLAEAQDGGGANNANMATLPDDGEAPRMQMYLFQSDTLPIITVGGDQYPASGAFFEPRLTRAGVAAPLKQMVPNLGCTAAPKRSLSGKIAIIDRAPQDDCSSQVKIFNAQAAGAVAAIIVDYDDAITPMSPDQAFKETLRIPAALVTASNGAAIKATMPRSASIKAQREGSSLVDAALDADVVMHEYAHGLTMRAVGFFRYPPLSAAFGEGASDVFSFLESGDDRIGPYILSEWFLTPDSPNNVGVRRWRYRGYPLTYGNASGTNTRPHNSGEIYAAAMWRVRELYLAAGLSVEVGAPDSLLDDWVGGLFNTHEDPTFEQARDGMLWHLERKYGKKDTTRRCLVWRAFAHFGIGQGAKGADVIDLRDPTRVLTVVNESFELPEECRQAGDIGAADAAERSALPPSPHAWAWGGDSSE